MKTIAASVGKYTSLVIASIVMLLPIALIITGSFKTNQEFLSTGAFTAPENWFNFSNYGLFAVLVGSVGFGAVSGG